MNYSELFRVKPGNKVKLDNIDPNFTAKYENQNSALPKLEKYTQKLRDLQYLLYAEGKQSLLICLQALDAGGKDGTINHAFWTMNAQGARVHGFKVPSKEEAEHDFLWRIHKQAPARGEVVIFNRSHYEDVLVVRVHNLVPKERLLKALRGNQRLRKEPCSQCHPYPQILSAHQPGRAAPAFQAAP